MEWEGDELNAGSWRGAVRNRLLGLEWVRVAADVQPFLEPKANLAVLTKENLLVLLG